MKRNLRSVIASAAVLTITGGVLAATVGTAAASYPGSAWQPAPATEQIGTLSLFNAAGNQITSGSDISHMFDYALASSAGPTDPNGIANLEFANPQNGTDPGTWFTASDESSNYPNTGATTPASVKNNANPVVTLDSSGADLAAVKGGFNQSGQPAGYVNNYEIRVYTTDAGKYWSADVSVSGTSWTETFGSPVTSTTTVSASPSPATAGSTVTLTATVTDANGVAPAGTVTFTSGGSTLGSSSTFNGSGQATATTSSLPQGDDTITATFVPSNVGSVTYSGSNGTTSEHINPPATATTTTLAISGNTQTGTDATLSGSVHPAGPGGAVGTVSLFDNGSSTPINPTPLAIDGTGTNTYSYTLVGGFTAGPHSVVAKFTPTTPANFAASQSDPVPFTTALAGGVCSQEAAATPPGPDCTDTQNIKAEIPTGTLIISTPYHAGNPLDLGNLQLNSGSTLWTGSAPFQCITVTDTNGVNSGFIAQASSSILTRHAAGAPTPPAGAVTQISDQNVGLTGLTKSPASETCNGGPAVNSYTNQNATPSSVTTTNNPAGAGVTLGTGGNAGLGGGNHTILTGSPNDLGTVTYDGLLTLNAPTSTYAGTYEGTITFTVTDGD